MSAMNDEDHEEIARSIFNDMLNNDWDAADQKIIQNSDYSPILSYCGAFRAVIRAILLFENEQFKSANKYLDDCQMKCNADSDTNTFSAFKRLFSFTSNSNLLEKPTKNLAEKIMNEIISADCRLYSSALAIAQHNSLASIIGGVLNLRSAWITYESTHKKLEKLLNSQQNTETDEKNNDEIAKKDIEKLLSAVSYGYGIVQLCFSFLGNHLMKIANFFGFESDRENALKALRYCSNSNDLRAPFADAVLILYSTIGVWLFGYSEIEHYIPANQVEIMIEKNLEKCSQSCLFLYLKAKYYQLLMKNSEKALEILEITFTNAKNAREIQTLIYYEMALLHLTNLNYEKAKENFIPFSEASHWSRSFNAYVIILLNGCLNEFSKMKIDLENALKIPKRQNPIDQLANKRLQYLKINEENLNKELCEFFIVELLYLWVLIPYCSEDHTNTMIKKLEKQNENNLMVIKHLILGSINMKLNNNENAQKHFKEVLKNETDTIITKYCHPYTFCHLTTMSLCLNKVDEAKQHLKNAHKFSNFEFHDRLYAHMRSLNRQIDQKQ